MEVVDEIQNIIVKRSKLVLFKEKKNKRYENIKKRQRSNSQMSIKSINSTISNNTIITRKSIWTDMISEKTNKKKIEDFIEDKKTSHFDVKENCNLSVDTAFKKKRKISEHVENLENITEVI